MRGRTLLIASLLTAAYAGQAAAGVVDSPHDLSSSTALDPDNTEVCVYCHTPHGAADAEFGPLWNRPSVSATYTGYDSITIDGDIIGSVGDLDIAPLSVACLSCHDGTQATDVVINAPGPDFDGNNLAASGAGWDLDTTTGFISGAAAIGIDLSNDHPIAIQYGGFVGVDGQIDEDIKPLGGDGLAKHATKALWWVDTTTAAGSGTDGVRDKTDMILYTRGVTPEPYIECATCHDVHNGSDTATVTQVAFLRMPNTGSDLCLACHIK